MPLPVLLFCFACPPPPCLQSLVRLALPVWQRDNGWGVLLLLYSALLSRGCDAVRADMDSPDTQLVDSLGYCSMELVNLLCTGAAVSNVFDGNQCFGEPAGAAGASAAAAGAVGSAGIIKDTAAAAGMKNTGAAGGAGGVAAEGGAGSGGGGDSSAGQLVLRGVCQRARVGLLTLFEWYRYMEVGQHLKSPGLPVWVVCSESHFSVMALDHSISNCTPATEQQQQQQWGALQQVGTAALKPSAGAPLVLQYYDGLSKQQGPIMLEVQPAAVGRGWSSRMEGVCEERGVWQGQPIPPLECVLETKWRDVAVVWHGSEPIL